MKRSRPVYLAATLIVIAAGLLSRRCPEFLPAMLGKYPGDALWTMMVFCGLGFLFPRLRTNHAGWLAFAISCGVELSQLYHAPWLESWRDTLPGRLILGRGFAWADLMAYAIGAGLAIILESTFRPISRPRPR